VWNPLVTRCRVPSDLGAVTARGREADPQDGRASLVRATTAGEQIIAGVRSERLHELHNRLERLTDEQRTALAAAVPALEALVAEDV